MKASELLARTRKADYTKYQVRRDANKRWHAWCPVCVTWMCCKGGSNGYLTWVSSTKSLAYHRKIWHT